MEPIRICLFASHPFAAAAFARLLARQHGFCLVPDGEPFQVGVFDGELPRLDAALTLARFKFPSMRALLLSSDCDEGECLRWLFRGIWGLVPYERYLEDLPAAVRQLARGQLWFSGDVLTHWMRIDSKQRASAFGVPLTPREREVMDFVVRRLSNKEIANVLRISERTVKFHVGNIFGKLRVHSREELAGCLLPRTTPA